MENANMENTNDIRTQETWSKQVEHMEEHIRPLTSPQDAGDKDIAGAATRAIERLMRLRVKLILREAKGSVGTTAP